NGWDDRNGDKLVDYPDECVLVVDGLPRGGLQMAERTLSGEPGSLGDRLNSKAPRVPTADRDHDCVPEIDDARLPAALASSPGFAIHRGPRWISGRPGASASASVHRFPYRSSSPVCLRSSPASLRPPPVATRPGKREGRRQARDTPPAPPRAPTAP